MVACLPCAAAAGPPGMVAAAAGAVGYGIYKSNKRNKTQKKSKKSKKQKGGNHLKKDEIVKVKFKTGNKRNLKFVRYYENDKAVLKSINKNKKGTFIIELNRIEKIPKTIANTKKRQKTKREKLVRTKRGIKTKSSTLELPNSEDSIDNLLTKLELL